MSIRERPIKAGRVRLVIVTFLSISRGGSAAVFGRVRDDSSCFAVIPCHSTPGGGTITCSRCSMRVCFMNHRRGRDDDDESSRNASDESDQQQKQKQLDMSSADVPSLARRRKRRQHPSREKRLKDYQRRKQQRQKKSRSTTFGTDTDYDDMVIDNDDMVIDNDDMDATNFDGGTWQIDDSVLDSALQVDESFESSIDSFLDGEYSQTFADDTPAPHPKLEPSEALDCALRALRKMDEPFESHGAAVFLRFCAPLSRGERWGGGSEVDPWKAVLRGAITPTMLARRLRASPFSGLLDWERLDVTEGLAVPSSRRELGVGTTIAFVSAALYFGDGVEPSIIQFTLRKIAGTWLIDTAVVSRREWFSNAEDGTSSDDGTPKE